MVGKQGEISGGVTCIFFIDLDFGGKYIFLIPFIFLPVTSHHRICYCQNREPALSKSKSPLS